MCELGEVGRGKGSRVDLEAVKRWRGQKAQDTQQQQRTATEFLGVVVRSLADVMQEDAAHRRVQIEKAKACGLLALAYQRIWQAVSMQSPDEYYICQPPEIEQLCAIWLRSIEDR